MDLPKVSWDDEVPSPNSEGMRNSYADLQIIAFFSVSTLTLWGTLHRYYEIDTTYVSGTTDISPHNHLCVP